MYRICFKSLVSSHVFISQSASSLWQRKIKWFDGQLSARSVSIRFCKSRSVTTGLFRPGLMYAERS